MTRRRRSRPSTVTARGTSAPVAISSRGCVRAYGSRHVLADLREVEPGRLGREVCSEVLHRKPFHRAVSVARSHDLVDPVDEWPDVQARLLVDVAGLEGVVRG